MNIVVVDVVFMISKEIKMNVKDKIDNYFYGVIITPKEQQEHDRLVKKTLMAKTNLIKRLINETPTT